MRIFYLLLVVTLLTGTALGQKAGSMTIKVYFHSDKHDPAWMECNKVYPVTRTIPRTQAVATAALQELFKGTTADESARQFSGFPPEATRGILKSVKVRRGAAYVNFTKAVYEQMGVATTSCGGGFFAMVEETLK